MLNNIKIGQIGEDIATKYLIERQYRILKRNYKERSDEIDIIAISRDGLLVFFEVKALFIGDTLKDPSLTHLTPEDNLSALKLRKISRACQIFAGKHPEIIDPDKGWQIDLLAIDVTTGEKAKNIRHYENI